jgi:hypothetical protein
MVFPYRGILAAKPFFVQPFPSHLSVIGNFGSNSFVELVAAIGVVGRRPEWLAWAQSGQPHS